MGAAALGGLAPSALADTTVPGSQYRITFAGTGTSSVDYGSSGHQTGNFQMTDPEGDLWLPKSITGAAEGYHDGADLNQPDSATFPASINFRDDSAPYDCTANTIGVLNQAVISAGIEGGALKLATDYDQGVDNIPNIYPRVLTLAPPSGCDDPPTIRYPLNSSASGVSNSYDPNRDGDVKYGATLSPSSVGQDSFTMPATDESTINQASGWSSYPDGGSSSHTFSVSGTYSFAKICDGTITYRSGSTVVQGACGAGGGGAGGGASGTQGAPKVSVHAAKATSTGVTVTASCTGAASCAIGTTLSTTETTKGGKPVAVSAGKKKSHKATVVVGSKTVTAASGKTVTIKVGLNARGRALLKRFHKLPVSLKVFVKSGAQQIGAQHRRLSIKAKGKRKKK